MHHVASHAQAAFQVPPAYAPHSQGYSRAELVDHTIAGAAHTGLGLCQLDVQGALNPHAHFYEEAFFVLEGPVVARIDGHDVLLGPGDYGIIPPGVPHALGNGREGAGALVRGALTAAQGTRPGTRYALPQARDCSQHGRPA